MIPKIIHYCWFGGNTLPELAIKCIESWKKFCPDYEIVRWDETNFDIQCMPYVNEAYKAKKWAFVSDYARLKVVYDNGGIYLDTDVELIKPLDQLLDDECFFCSETDGYVNTGLGFGAEKGNSVIKLLLQEYSNRHFEKARGIYDLTPCPAINSAPLIRMGYKFSDSQIWRTDEVAVYPPEYFCPLDYLTNEMKITENTVSIHLFSALWVSEQAIEIKKMLDELSISSKGIFFLVKKQINLYRIAKKYGDCQNFLGYCVKKIWEKICNFTS